MDEATRISRRIKKAIRRIARGVRVEEEQARVARLTARLQVLDGRG